MGLVDSGPLDSGVYWVVWSFEGEVILGLKFPGRNSVNFGRSQQRSTKISQVQFHMLDDKLHDKGDRGQASMPGTHSNETLCGCI